ncbi:hypothetical protein [Vagococcus sp. WN89Y]|uniref:hypothetical protein n=1 Tax=Vagococcus sp. WN89Y TaxID=3457258 RepID=UPI003FCC5DE5
MDVRGSHGHTPVPGHDTIELATRNTTSAAATVDRAAAARNEEIGRIAHALEDKCTGGAEIRDYLREIAVVLHDEMGQTADDVKDVIKNAHHHDRNTSALAEGAIGLTYALSGMPGDLIGKGIASAMGLQGGTPAHDFVTGLAGGLTAVGFKAVLSKVIGNSLQNGKWMQADMDALAPVMQEVMKKRNTLGHQFKQAALGGTGYDIRNPFTGAVSTGTQMLEENAPRAKPMGILEGARQAGYLGNQATGLALTIGAGALSGVIQNRFDNMHGAEFLFGRNDWQERYQALSSGRKHSAEGGRFDELKQNAKTPKTWLDAMRNLVALSQIAEGIGLGTGLGVANITKGAARTSLTSALAHAPATAQELMKNPSFRAIREGVGQAAYLIPAAGAYFEQGAAGIMYNELKRAVLNKLHPAEENESSSSSTSTTTEDSPVSSGARTPDGSPPESEAASVGTLARTPDGSPPESEAASVGTLARTPDGSPPESEAASVGTLARTPDGSPPESEAASVGTLARTPDGSPPESEAASVGTLARTPDGSPPESEAASVGERAKTPSDAGRSESSDSASIRTHYSGTLRNTPPPRSEEMRAQGDTHPWWTDFPNAPKTQPGPKPETLSPDEAKALAAHIETEAQEMNTRIAEMIPLPKSEPASSAASVKSEPSEVKKPA